MKEYLSPDFSMPKNKQVSDGAVKEAYQGLPRLTCLHVGDAKFGARRHIFPCPGRAGARQQQHPQQNLAALSLYSSRLITKPFPKAAFHSLTSLHTMNFSQLRSVNSPSSSPSALKELYLAASKISVIPTDVFSELSELEKLDLSHNQITEKGIKKAAFGNMIKLENLNLAEDLLTGVPSEFALISKRAQARQKQNVFSEARGISETRKSHSGWSLK